MEEAKGVLTNAHRLLADAAHLRDGGRHASAFALAVLALEEVGKVVLAVWRDESQVKAALPSANYHVRKQVAAVSLLLAQAATTAANADLSSEGITLDGVGRGTPDEEQLVRSVARAMAQGLEGRIFAQAVVGAMERTKHIGFYADARSALAGLSHADFDASDVDGAISVARQALDLLGNWRTVHTAKAMVLAPVR